MIIVKIRILYGVPTLLLCTVNESLFNPSKMGEGITNLVLRLVA